jgi:hypothetical protein
VPISENVYNKSRNRSFTNTVPLYYDQLYTVNELLELVLVHSASASIVALAELVDGSEAAFAEHMNAKAAEWGLQAWYQGASGIENNSITPRSMAILARNLLRDYPEVLVYTAKPATYFHGKTYAATNYLLGSLYYEGADGLKTGTTSAAGYCFTGTAVRNGVRIISVTMYSTSGNGRFTDTQKLLDYGFAVREARVNEANPVTAVTLSQDTLDLQTGEVARLSPALQPADATNKSLVWTSSNPSAVTVTPDGQLTAWAPGVSLIRARAASGVFADCVVTARGEGTFVPYYDVPRDAWFYPAALFTHQQGLLADLMGDTFEPEADFVRLLGAVMLYRAAGSPEMEAGGTTFFDVPAGQWYSAAVDWVCATGLMTGYDENLFGTNDPITREQFAVLLYRFAALTGRDTSARAELWDFADAETLSPWARDALSWAVSEKLLTGIAGKLAPQETATRAQCATLLMRFFTSVSQED